jgi:hypothetical protein
MQAVQSQIRCLESALAVGGECLGWCTTCLELLGATTKAYGWRLCLEKVASLLRHSSAEQEAACVRHTSGLMQPIGCGIPFSNVGVHFCRGSAAAAQGQLVPRVPTVGTNL